MVLARNPSQNFAVFGNFEPFYQGFFCSCCHTIV